MAEEKDEYAALDALAAREYPKVSASLQRGIGELYRTRLQIITLEARVQELEQENAELKGGQA